jgi:hypothetical protein
VYAAPLATGRSRFIGKGIVIPSETPGRVWLMPFGASPATYRLVDLTGHVLLAGKGRTSGWEPVAIPGGLAFSGAGGIELWDASRDAPTGTLGSAGAQVGASWGSLLAWTRHDRADLQLTSLDTRATRPVSLPANVTGVDVSVARFSDDGTLLAVQANTKGAPDGTRSVLIVDVEHARVVRTIAPKAQFESFAWSPDGARLYLGSYGYQQPTMSVRRVDVASGRETDYALPFGGGITFHVVSRRGAGVALQGVAAGPTDCAAPAALPSNGTEPCRFHY